MKALPNEIILRPRFQMQLKDNKERVLNILETSEKKPFLVKRLDEHIFIKFNAEKNHFWSPQLHLEIEEIDTRNCKLYGVFGPNPTLWTFFIFIHFGLGTIFIILLIWAYSSATLHRPYGLQLGLMVLTVILWFIFYALGRAGRYKGKPQMQQLHQFLIDTLKE